MCEVCGLNGVWGFGFFLDGFIIVIEKCGCLYFIKDGECLCCIFGLLDIKVQGQGGLLDVVFVCDFVISFEIFFIFVGVFG